MGATPKILRKAPPRRFENYILTRETAGSVNLVNIPDSLFLPCSPALGGYTDPGVGYTDDGVSTLLDIGFDFQIDNIIYKKFVVCSNGWMVLTDPTTGTFSPSEVLDGSIWVNSAIKPTFTSQAILLAPWFDDLRNMAATPEQLQAVGTIQQTKATRLKSGLETPIVELNASQNSVKYYIDNRSSRGRRLIVRWNSLSNFFTPGTTLRFEAVIYENGTIEYRYVARQNITVSSAGFLYEDATIGIFMPNGTDRWRDFSYGLGHRDDERQQYRYGGAVLKAGFSELIDGNTRNYVSNLKPNIHWPGLDGAGSMYTFQPPVNRRRVLPKLEQRNIDSRQSLPTVSRTGDARRGNDTVNFDDRQVVIYGSEKNTLVNYPTTLPRFYSDSKPGIAQRQNLFAGDFELTGSIVPTSTEQYILVQPQRSIEPFSEHKLFENDPNTSIDPFFSNVSSLEDLGDGLTQPLRAKTQIRLSLPINHNCELIGTASTIHYYNRRSNAWNTPQNSSYIISNAAITNDSGKSNGDIVHSLVSFGNNRRILEDHRGFGPIGNILASGTVNPTAGLFAQQTDRNIGSSYTSENVTLALSKQYGKSITNNEQYRASVDEVFKLPINHPFLIERAIIEIPFAAGDGWFADKTTCLATHENIPAGFDFAGPALTVALFNQTIAGNVSKRDLILTGTFTHDQDNVSEIVFSAFPPITSTFQIRPRGFRAFGAIPGAIVTGTPNQPGSGLTFTGSVPIRCEAQVSNGVIARLEMSMTGGTATTNRQGVLDVFNSSQLSLGHRTANNFLQSCYIAYINNFGRAGTGFDPSGRSVFGKEFVATQALTVDSKINNPFYLTGTNGGAVLGTYVGLSPQFTEAVSTGTAFKFELALPLMGHRPSPYMVMPGDSLVLAISKTRPVFLGSQAPPPYTSGSIQHDVTLMTGAINIVLYGSMLREGKEFHDTLNQSLSSNAIHEIVVGNEPILDQFETDYRDTFISGTYDDFVAGSMLTKVVTAAGRTIFVTGSVLGSTTTSNILSRGSRGRIFGRNNARLAPTPGTSEFDFTTSTAFRLQPYHEKAGMLRNAQATDSSERFWDSLLPAVNQCFLADGTGIFLLKPGGVTIGGTLVDQRIGFLWFDYQAPIWFPTWGKILDGIWTKSYPFEPRYSAIPRQQFIEKSIIANYEVDFGYSSPYNPGVFDIEPKPLAGFFFGPVGSRLPSVPTLTPADNSSESSHNFLWTSDAYLNHTTGLLNLTSSAGIADVSKALFGFGDLNNIMRTPLDSSGKTTFGTNHYVDSRKKVYDQNNWGSWFSYSPIVRGWKYGIYSGLPTFSKAYFRQGRYGQMRDMLEQRLNTKYYQSSEKNPDIENFQQGTTPACVSISFVDAAGKLTRPENTWSQNLSFEATSSVPYFDGETRNRPPINANTLNANIIAFKTNQFGQVTL